MIHDKRPEIKNITKYFIGSHRFGRNGQSIECMAFGSVFYTYIFSNLFINTK